jgi:uncharacterized membrane protein
MSELIAIVYPTEHRAREVLSSMRDLQEAHVIELIDVCYVTKDARDKVELHQTVNLTTHGAFTGAFWGSLVGLLFLNPLIGLVAGAATGAVAGRLSDYGISDDFMRRLGREMEVGKATVFVLVRKATTDKLTSELARHGGEVIHTSLSTEAEARLRARVAGFEDGPPAPRVRRAFEDHDRGTS